MEENQEMTMKEVVAFTGLSEHTIRNYLSDFNIHVEHTQGGHRRFTEESIKQLKLAKKLKEEQGLSIKQIRSYFNGETLDVMLEEPELKSNLEKKLEKMDEKMNSLIDINLQLMKKMDEQEKRHQVEIQLLGERISNEMKENQEQILLETKSNEEENDVTKEVSPPLFSRIFSRKKDKKNSGM